MLPWAFPSQGSSSPALTSISARLLPCASPRLRVTPRLGMCTSESRSADASPDHMGRTPLSGFSRLNIPGTRPLAPVRAMCSPCRSRRVATPTPPALWTEAGLPKLSGLLVGDDQAPPFSSKRKIHRARSESNKNPPRGDLTGRKRNLGKSSRAQHSQRRQIGSLSKCASFLGRCAGIFGVTGATCLRRRVLPNLLRQTHRKSQVLHNRTDGTIMIG